MKNNVNVIINSIHSSEYGKDTMQVNAEGTYYSKNGKHYICYKETDEESGEISNSLLKVWENSAEMIKRSSGGTTRLHFEAGKLNNTYLQTVMGKLFVGVDTKHIEAAKENDMFKIIIEYSLIIEGEKASDCKVEVLVKDMDLGN